MARTSNAKVNTKNDNLANFEIIGTLINVFEGEKKNYLTIRVDSDEINSKTNKPFYSTYNIGVEKSVELYDDNTKVNIKGYINSYFDKEAKSTVLYLNGTTVDPVSKS